MNYQIIMDKNDFFKIHNRIAVKDLRIDENKAYFTIELGSYTILKETGYSFKLVDSFKIYFKKIMSKYYLLLIGLIFLFSILYINTFRIKRIEFNLDTPINTEIESELKGRMRSLYFFDFLDIDYNEYSSELRRKYSEYPYIETFAKNNILHVNLFQNESFIEKSTNDISGDIIASKDGIITEFYVYNGQSYLSKNKYVKKGDILIGGTINNKILSAKGKILAYTYEKKYVEIPKEEMVSYITDKSSYYQINLFSKIFNVSKNKEFSNYNQNDEMIFNLFDIFSIKKIEEEEKSDIIEENSKDIAIEKGIKKIKDEFELSKTINDEEIIDIKCYNIVENENSYSIEYILKMKESIGEFVSY